MAEEAVRMARQPGSPFGRNLSSYLDTLARAHFVSGDLDEAVRFQEEALSSLPPNTDPRMRGQMQRVLAEYRAARGN